MDSELSHLSVAAKEEMIAVYRNLPRENRNERGTIAFLIGRSLDRPEDARFLESILKEKPCLSLSDCSKAEGDVSGEAAHLQGISETTAQYPELMTIRALKEKWEAKGADAVTGAARESVKEAILAARSSPLTRVAETAKAIQLED